MKRQLVLILTALLVLCCAQASAAIITGEWEKEMIEGISIPRFSTRLQGDELVTVYNGPGREYGVVYKNRRASDLYCAGLEGNWALVQTDWNEYHDTPGYIDITELKTKPELEQLHFAYIQTKLYEDCSMLKRITYGYSDKYECILRRDDVVTLLTQFGDYAYVEVQIDGKPVRGFLHKEDYPAESFYYELRNAGYFAGNWPNLKELYAYQYAVLKKDSIAAGMQFTVGVRSNGRVDARGDNSYGRCDVLDWENIVAVSVGFNHTVGLRSDGTVVAVGDNTYGQCNVSAWKNIVAISAGGNHTVALSSDGFVYATGDNTFHQIDLWDRETMGNIVAISAGGNFTAALTGAGRVLISGNYTSLAYQISTDDWITGRAYIDTENWSRIISISAGSWHVVGLQADGRVVATGESASGQLDTEEWENVVQIAAGGERTVALQADGTLQHNGHFLTYDVDWSDVVYFAASETQLVGLRSDGTVDMYPVDVKWYVTYTLSDWDDIGLPEDQPVFTW